MIFKIKSRNYFKTKNIWLFELSKNNKLYIIFTILNIIILEVIINKINIIKLYFV